MRSTIDTHALELRNAVLDTANRRMRIAEYTSTTQERDLRVPPNCGGFGRIHHFGRFRCKDWLVNPLPIDPACRALGLPAQDEMTAQVFQLAACNWECWYCYVPENLRNADNATSPWITADELITRYIAESTRPMIIDLTGGQPDLVPEWTLWMMDAICGHGIESSVYLWSDDNLSVDFFWRFLTDEERLRIATYRHYGRVGCFKGICPESFAFNTGADPAQFDNQFTLMRRFIEFGFDQYAYVTFTTIDRNSIMDAVPRFVDRLQSVDANLPLRTVPLEIIQFTPVQARALSDAQIALENQHLVADVWEAELAQRFSATERAMNITEVQFNHTP